MTDLLDYLLECQKVIGKFTVTEEFIQYRETERKKQNPGDRTLIEHQIDCDCLIMEYLLLKNKLAESPDNMHHDIKWKEYKPDLKYIRGQWLNISSKKYEWFLKGIKLKEVTHIPMYRGNLPDRPLVVGDVVETRLVDLKEIKWLMTHKNKSGGDGWYYTPPNNLIYD
jgi:hypothetical protein